MDKRKSKSAIIAVVVLTVFVGIAATIIALYYSQIQDVTPGQSDASQLPCACYIFPASLGSTAACPADGTDGVNSAIYSEIGTLTNNVCSVNCSNPSLYKTTAGSSKIYQEEYKGPTTSTCETQFGANCTANGEGNCLCTTEITNSITCTAPAGGARYSNPFGVNATSSKYCSNLSTGSAPDKMYTSPIDPNLPSIKVYATFISSNADITATTDPTSFKLTVNGQLVTSAPTVLIPETQPLVGKFVNDVIWTVPNSMYNTASTLSMSATINNSSVNYTPCYRDLPIATAQTPTNISCRPTIISPLEITPVAGTTNKLDGIEVNFNLPSGDQPTSYRMKYTVKEINTANQAIIASVVDANDVVPCVGNSTDHCVVVSAGRGKLTLLNPYMYANNFKDSGNPATAIAFPNLPTATGSATEARYNIIVEITGIRTAGSSSSESTAICDPALVKVKGSTTPPAGTATCQIAITPSTSTTGTLSPTNIAITGTNLPTVNTADPTVKMTFTFPGSSVASIQNANITSYALAATGGTINLNSAALTAISFPTFPTIGTGTNPTTYNVASSLTISGTAIICTPISVSVSPQAVGTGATSSFTVSKVGPRCVERVAPNNSATFTMTITNTATNSQPLRSFKDKLPMGFTYVENSTVVNGVATPDSGLVTTNTVGSSQEITWNRTSGWALLNGEIMLVTFRATANTAAITGQNQNEVVLDPVNTPTNAASIRTTYVFNVASNCSTPQTGLFDATEAKIGIGLIVLLVGVIFYYTSFGTQLSENIAANSITKGASKIGSNMKSKSFKVKITVKDKAKMTWLRVAYPTKYFEAKTMRRKKNK